MQFENLGMKSYLLPKNKCGYIGNEKELKSTDTIKVFKSNNGSYRYIKYVSDTPVSCIQIVYDGKIAQIANVITIEQERRKGYAKELFYFAKLKFKKIFHSYNLSPLGKKFANNVN